MRLRALVLLAACTIALTQTPRGSLRAQGTGQQADVGDLLIASEKLGDPNFVESVVLILNHEEDTGTLGVIINRRSHISLARVFPEIKGAGADPVYVGGPVSITAVQALLKLPDALDDVRHISGDVYATGSKQVIEKSVSSHAAPSKFRLYVGYAGWAPGQLEAEIQLGAWTVLRNQPKLIFDEDPDSLWERLTHESHMQIAMLHPSR